MDESCLDHRLGDGERRQFDLPGADPIRRQLLGVSPNGGFGYTSPADEDVPLKTWLAERLGADALAA